MRVAIAKADLTRQPDSVAHCTAAGLIARYCSVTEASMASIGKELRDLFTAGDAQWRDLLSDKRGVSCARQSRNDQELSACCGEDGGRAGISRQEREERQGRKY
jgi:hypothetical protein